MFQMGQEAGLVLFLKAHHWYHSPEREGAFLGGCSQMLKQLPPLLEVQSCQEAGMGRAGNVPVAAEERVPSVIPEGMSWGHPGTHCLCLYSLRPSM